MNIKGTAVATHAIAFGIGVFATAAFNDVRLNKLLEHTEATLATTQIRWNTAILELLSKGEYGRAIELIDRQTDSKTSNLAASIARGASVNEDDVAALQRAIREREGRGQSAAGLKTALETVKRGS